MAVGTGRCRGRPCPALTWTYVALDRDLEWLRGQPRPSGGCLGACTSSRTVTSTSWAPLEEWDPDQITALLETTALLARASPHPDRGV